MPDDETLQFNDSGRALALGDAPLVEDNPPLPPREANPHAETAAAAAAEVTRASSGDASPAAATTGEPALTGRLAALEDTAGWYIVLWARRPKHKLERPRYEEIGYVKASSPEVARARALEHDGRNPKPIEERGEIAQFLAARAAEKPGIFLRAVPAMHWPTEVPTTTMVRPAPVLVIG